jgi:hypothetical protein
MPGDSAFAPPVHFSPVWIVIAVVILVAIVGWYVFVWWLTRRRWSTDAAATSAPLTSSGYRATYLGVIDEVAAAYRAGELSSAQAHQRLSLVVREFAAGIRGIRAPYMTLEDLRASRVGPLAQTVEELYPGAFGGEGTGSVDDALDSARALVSGWR